MYLLWPLRALQWLQWKRMYSGLFTLPKRLNSGNMFSLSFSPTRMHALSHSSLSLLQTHFLWWIGRTVMCSDDQSLPLTFSLFLYSVATYSVLSYTMMSGCKLVKLYINAFLWNLVSVTYHNLSQLFI